MPLYDGPGDRLAGNLDLIIDNFRAERAEYWNEDAEAARLVLLCDLMAEALVASSSNLVFVPEGVPWKTHRSPWADVANLAAEQGFADHLADSVEIVLAADLIREMYDAPKRCLDLAHLVLSAQPSTAVQKYLNRLGRCYVMGLLQECVILSRAVLENAVRELIVREEGAEKQTFKNKSTMKERLDAAEGARLISPAARRDAGVVWKRGNTAIHNDPDATQDVLGTIRMTMRVLEEIYATT